MLEIVLNLFLVYIVILLSVWFVNGLIYGIIVYWKLVIRFKKGFKYYYGKNEKKLFGNSKSK